MTSQESLFPETTIITTIEADKRNKDWKANDNYVYIGRNVFHLSLKDLWWGSPYIIGNTSPQTGLPMMEEEVVELYERWCYSCINNYTFRQKLYNLHGKILVQLPTEHHGKVLRRLSESVYHHQNQVSEEWSKQPSLVDYKEEVERQKVKANDKEVRLMSLNKELQEAAKSIVGYESMKVWKRDCWKPFMKEVNSEKSTKDVL